MSKINISFFNINWAESDKIISGEACFGYIVINKNENIAYIFGVSGTKKWYASGSKSLNTNEKKINELKDRLNSYHISRLKYIMGSWVTIKEN